METQTSASPLRHRPSTSRGASGACSLTLAPFAADTPSVRAALIDIGKPGGIMDAGDDLTDPLALLANAALSADNPDNPTMTAGFTFLGQFIDHDMTFDPTSEVWRGARTRRRSATSASRPSTSTTSMAGPRVSPALYDQSVDEGRTTMLVEEIPGSAAVTIDGQPRFDLPRNSQNVAPHR